MCTVSAASDAKGTVSCHQGLDDQGDVLGCLWEHHAPRLQRGALGEIGLQPLSVRIHLRRINLVLQAGDLVERLALLRILVVSIDKLGCNANNRVPSD